MGPTWGPSGSCWPKMGPMVAPWILLSEKTSAVTSHYNTVDFHICTMDTAKIINESKLWVSFVSLMHWGQDKMAAMSHITFSNACSWIKGLNWQYSIIGSDNGLAPTRWQAIIWTIDGKFTDAYMWQSASMSESMFLFYILCGPTISNVPLSKTMLLKNTVPKASKYGNQSHEFIKTSWYKHNRTNHMEVLWCLLCTCTEVLILYHRI